MPCAHCSCLALKYMVEHLLLDLSTHDIYSECHYFHSGKLTAPKPCTWSSLWIYLNRACETPPALRSDGVFVMLAIDLVDSQSTLARTSPHLHRVLRDRLDSALAAREGVRASLAVNWCNHTSVDGHELGRSDGVAFRHEEDSELVSFLTHANADDTTMLRPETLCDNVSDRIDQA